MTDTGNSFRRQPVCRTPFRIATFAMAPMLLVLGCAGQFPQFGGGSSAKSTSTNPPAASSIAVSSASGRYQVTIGIPRGAGRLGAVQFDVSANGAGEWIGAAAKVSCTDLAGAAMKTCNNKGNGRLSCALINPNGMGTPTDLVRCDFQAKQAVAASNFVVKVKDASNTSLKPVSVAVVVTSVRAG